MASDNKTPKEQAIALIYKLERLHQNDSYPNQQIQNALGKAYEKADAQTPRNRVAEQHVIEIARAYLPLSDGNGGFIPKAERLKKGFHVNTPDPSKERFDAAVRGFMSDGRSPLTSQREALQHGLHDLLTPELQERHGKTPPTRRDVEHGTEGTRPVRHSGAHQNPAERVSVSIGTARPMRGFATVAVMATAAALTAFTIPALEHLGLNSKTDDSAIRMTSLTDAANGLSASSTTKLQSENDSPGMRVFAQRVKPPASSGPN